MKIFGSHPVSSEWSCIGEGHKTGDWETDVGFWMYVIQMQRFEFGGHFKGVNVSRLRVVTAIQVCVSERINLSADVRESQNKGRGNSQFDGSPSF